MLLLPMENCENINIRRGRMFSLLFLIIMFFTHVLWSRHSKLIQSLDSTVVIHIWPAAALLLHMENCGNIYIRRGRMFSLLLFFIMLLNHVLWSRHSKLLQSFDSTIVIHIWSTATDINEELWKYVHRKRKDVQPLILFLSCYLLMFYGHGTSY